VASYSAVINVSVSGQAALDKLEGSARNIQTLIQGIKQQKDIFNQAVGTEKTRELKKNLENLVNSFALARDGARQFEVTVGGKTQKVNMYSKTLAGLSNQLGTFRVIADNAAVGSDRFVNSLIAANKVSNELARTQAKAISVGTGVTGTPKNVQEVLALGKAIPDTIEGLTFYKSKLEELLATLKLTSNEFRAVEEASAAVDVRLGNARLTGQTSAITPAAGPASRIDTVASYEKRANYAQKIADLEYKQLTTGQQIVKAKLTETQQEELQNRLGQASEALAKGDLALAQRLTVELRNQRILYERTNRDREALMRPTSMVAGANLPVRGGKDIIGSPINLQEGTKAAVALAQQKQRALADELAALQRGTEAAVALARQKEKAAADELTALQGGTKAAVALAQQKLKAAADELTALQQGTEAAVALARQKEKAAADELAALQTGTKAAVSLGQQKLKATGPEQAEASQKRLNNLLNSALIAEQAIIKTAAKGIDVKDQQAQIQSAITKLQQLDATATSAELSTYDTLLNLIRNELKLKRAIASADAASAKSTKEKTKATKEDKKSFGLSDAVIGGAFPLLFGQGIGASLGGALGGGIGSRVGGGKGGFGGSLVGTIVGQATIDFAINSALKLGKTLEAPTSNIEQFIELLGIAGTGLKSNIRVLQELGLTSTASSLALAKLEATLGAEGFKNAEEFSKDGQNLANAFSRLQLALANLANGALPGILDFLTNAIKIAANAGLPRGGSLGAAAGVATATTQKTAGQLRAENFIGPTPDADLTLERAAQQAITQEKQRQLTLAAAQKNLEENRLSLTRVDLAAEQGRIAVLQIQNDLTRKQLELSKETEATKRSLLDLDIKLLEQQQAQAQAAQRNAVIEAQRAVTRQIGGLMIEQTELENQIFVLRSESAKLLQGEAVGLASELNNLEQRYQNEIDILFVRRDLEKLGVNEVEVLQEINTKYDGLAAVVQQRLNNERETLKQQEAQYNLTQLQIKQQRELANLETSGRFQLELQRTQSFQDPTGIGFFGDALLNQKLNLEEYTITLRNYDAQLRALREGAAIEGLNTDVGIKLTQEADKLQDQIALYKEYQPAIIQARLEQEKFNAVFNATSPIVDNLFTSISNVVAGTMTAKEAFASFLTSIADMLADTAKKMIAQYIAIGIARMFAGVPGGSGGSAFSADTLPAVGDVGTGFNFDTGAMLNFGGFKANGGPVSSGQMYMVGERGPELFVPGRSGTIVPNDQMGGGGEVNVVVNVDAKGSNVAGNDQDANQLGRVISAAVQSELIKQQRPGGLLTR